MADFDTVEDAVIVLDEVIEPDGLGLEVEDFVIAGVLVWALVTWIERVPIADLDGFGLLKAERDIVAVLVDVLLAVGDKVGSTTACIRLRFWIDNTWVIRNKNDRIRIHIYGEDIIYLDHGCQEKN